MTNRTADQRRQLLITTGRRLFALCAASLAVSVLFLFSGCTTTQLTAEDRSQLGRIGIARAYEKPIVEFSGVPNVATGAAEGVFAGLLYPPAWYLGGPFFFGPMAANYAARCGAQFNHVKDPAQQFDAAVDATRPDELLLKYLADRIEGAGLGGTSILESPLKRLDEGRFNVTSVSGQGIDTVLQIEQLKIGLATSYSDNKGGTTRSCRPKVTVDVVWRLIRVTEGKQIATGSVNTSVTSTGEFPAFFRDAPYTQSILKGLLEEVAGRTICTPGAALSQCSGARRGPATFTPTSVEPVHGNPQGVDLSR